MSKLEIALKLAPIVVSTGTSILAQLDEARGTARHVTNYKKFGLLKFSLITLSIVGLMQYARGDTKNLMDITIISTFAEFTKGLDIESEFATWLATAMSALVTYRNY